jgi:hypothetical protein
VKRNLFLLLLITLLLAACGGQQSAPTTAPTVEADTPPLATPMPATSAPPSIVPGGNPSILVSGDLSATVEANNFYIAQVKGSDETVVGTMLYLNQDDSRVVFIRFPWNAQPGTYQITQGFTDNYDGTTATGNFNEQSSGSTIQFAATSGSLTLAATGNAYTGSYEFTAQAESGQTVTVSGAFSAIPFQPPAS